MALVCSVQATGDTTVFFAGKVCTQLDAIRAPLAETSSRPPAPSCKRARYSSAPAFGEIAFQEHILHRGSWLNGSRGGEVKMLKWMRRDIICEPEHCSLVDLCLVASLHRGVPGDFPRHAAVAAADNQHLLCCLLQQSESTQILSDLQTTCRQVPCNMRPLNGRQGCHRHAIVKFSCHSCCIPQATRRQFLFRSISPAARTAPGARSSPGTKIRPGPSSGSRRPAPAFCQTPWSSVGRHPAARPGSLLMTIISVTKLAGERRHTQSDQLRAPRDAAWAAPRAGSRQRSRT